jgi:hypothetical protein
VSLNFNCSYIARSSLTYIPVLAHLAFRICELLSLLFVRRPSVHISHVNLLRNDWANCNQTLVGWSLSGPLPNLCLVIPTSNQDGRQAKTRKKGWWNSKKILLLWNYSANLNQTLMKWSLGDPLPKMCPAFQTSHQDGASAELNLTYDPMGNSHKNFLVWNHLINKN